MERKEAVLTRYDFQKNMTWTIEPGTLQYIDGQVIGMSLLGGNLLRIGQDGLMSLIWENQESPLVCGLYTHSIVFEQKIFFMPYFSKELIVYNYNNSMVERIVIPDRHTYERMNPYVHNGQLFLIAAESGRIYKYQKKGNFHLIDNSWEGGMPLFPKRDMSDGRKSVLQRKTGKTIEFCSYDCEKRQWRKCIVPDCTFRDFIWDNDYIWYASDEAVYEVRISESSSTSIPEKIFEFNQKKEFVSFVMKEDETFLMFTEKSNVYYQFYKESKHWEKIVCDFLDAEKNILAYQINPEILVIRQFDARDWMIRPGETYGIFHLLSGDYAKIPLFSLEESCRKLLNVNYIKSVWNVAPNHILAENAREGPEFLMATLETSQVLEI